MAPHGTISKATHFVFFRDQRSNFVAIQAHQASNLGVFWTALVKLLARLRQENIRNTSMNAGGIFELLPNIFG